MEPLGGGLGATVAAGVRGLCPRCGRAPLFTGFIDTAPRCAACGLDYGFADAGDGPAVFVSLFGGFVVVGAAFFAQLAFDPPIWLLLLIFLPLTLVVCVGFLRPLKGLLIALQYRTKAEQGRIEPS